MTDSTPLSTEAVNCLFRAARTNFALYVTAVHRPAYVHSAFSVAVCAAVDNFVSDLLAGKNPVLMLTAPPQFGKSSLISKCLPAYLSGRLQAELPAVRLVCASYALSLAKRNLRDAKGVLGDPIHREIFPECSLIDFDGTNTTDAVDTPAGSIKAVGVGGGLTGFSADCALIDDATKDAQAALSPTVQDGIEAWFDSVLLTRMQKRSGIVVIGTPWSANDFLARVRRKYAGAPSFRVLSFPALNLPSEAGYREDLPEGSLVPELHPVEQLQAIKATMSEFWWCSLYQQVPFADFGAIFKRGFLRYYRRAELPRAFERTVITVDAAFKDGAASDYVAVGVWGKSGADAYLLDWTRQKLSFTATAEAINGFLAKYPAAHRVYIEDAANGPALIDMLGKTCRKVEGVPPQGSKEARAFAVSWVWESGNVHLPDPAERPGITPVVTEITSFPDSPTGHDDVVDMMTLALHQLFVRATIAAMITPERLQNARR
jgi:predicted phage terminase large subunit-like protein